MLLAPGLGGTTVLQGFTGHDRACYPSCQYIKWVLVFSDWAQDLVAFRKGLTGTSDDCGLRHLSLSALIRGLR